MKNKISNFFLSHLKLFTVIGFILAAGSLFFSFMFYPVENGLLTLPLNVKVLVALVFIIGCALFFSTVGIMSLKQEKRRLGL